MMRKLYSFIVRNQRVFLFLFAVIALTAVGVEAFARLGGAGGADNADSSDSGGLVGLLMSFLTWIPFPFNIIAIAALVVVILVINKLRKRGSILNKIPVDSATLQRNSSDIDTYRLTHPDFDEEAFLKKAATAFNDLQMAWSQRNINKFRRYISDGMYQRINVQFKMMDLLGQQNVVDKLNIKDMKIDSIKSEGDYDIINVGIYASAKDRFISEKFPNLNATHYEEFIEYWTFIRKSSHAGGSRDMYDTQNCPNCGSNLNVDMGDMCKCPYCGTITNSGDYDWVLSSISQKDTYLLRKEYAPDSSLISDMLEDDDDLVAPIIEDKVCNGYLQLETAKVTNNPLMVRRFVTDSFYETFTSKLQTMEPFVYNRIFLDNVAVVGRLQSHDKNVIAVNTKLVYQRVSIKDGKATLIDPTFATLDEIVIVEKKLNAGANKGSVFAHQCPNCGGSLDDTANTNCPYCGSQINSGANDWVISNVMNMTEYAEFSAQNATEFVAKINPKNMAPNYKVRDYAFNNVLIMIAIDGVFDERELAFANKLAQKWGYATDKVQGMIELAKNQQLSLKMPDDPKMRTKIYRMMEKVAAADGNIAKEEQELLDNVKNQYL